MTRIEPRPNAFRATILRHRRNRTLAIVERLGWLGVAILFAAMIYVQLTGWTWQMFG